jgi:hypothetical protein
LTEGNENKVKLDKHFVDEKKNRTTREIDDDKAVRNESASLDIAFGKGPRRWLSKK